jgi:D-glycero-alpha-D-manno-heptose-7-phosphate kinase
MIGSMTPFRVSFAGGGSDLRAFYRENLGRVVSTTIDKHMYLFLHPSFDEKIQVKYSKTELVDEIGDVAHPIVREALRIFGLRGIDISSIADIPAGTGLGSSSAFTVGLFNALYGYIGEARSVQRLAEDACRLEVDILNEPIGQQDQYASAFGGLNAITFLEDDSVRVETIEMPPGKLEELDANLLMFYTGGRREARVILEDQATNMTDRKKRANLIQMTELAGELEVSLRKGYTDDMGRILDEGWRLKKSLSSKISCGDIDDIYDVAIRNGALGGKLLGAGGAGFFLFYCQVEKQAGLRSALGGLREMTFSFDPRGTRLILPNGA